jgi:flagellar basal body-associated protein FliL
MERRYPVLLVLAGVLVLAASAAMVWTFFAREDRTYLAYGAILFVTAVGVVFQLQWAKYIVYVYGLTSAVAWCFDLGYVVWFHPQPGIWASIVLLVPGFLLVAAMAAASWLIRRQSGEEEAEEASHFSDA